MFTIPRGTCPYLAIPIPGERPFVVERKLYLAATKGITITDTSLDKVKSTDKHCASGMWQLTVTHNSGRVHGKTVFYNLLQTRFASSYAYHEFKLSIAKWAESQKKKPSKSVGLAPKYASALKRLQREQSKLRQRRPSHPFKHSDNTESSRYERDYFTGWHAGKAERRAVGIIAAKVLDNRMTATTAYKLLRASGFDVRMYSQMTPRVREHYGAESEKRYWQFLYKFVTHGAHKIVFHTWDMTEALASHGQARIEYCDTLRAHRALQAQIDSVMQLAGMRPLADSDGMLYA